MGKLIIGNMVPMFILLTIFGISMYKNYGKVL